MPSVIFHGVRIQLDNKSRVVTEAGTSNASNKLLCTLQNLRSVNQLARDLLQRLNGDSLSASQRISGMILDPPHSNNDADG